MDRKFMPTVLIGLALSCFSNTVLSEEELMSRPNPGEKNMWQSSQKDLRSKARKADPAGPVSKGGTEKMGIVMEEKNPKASSPSGARDGSDKMGIVLEEKKQPIRK